MNLSIPVILSLLAAICYGLSGPFAKIGYNRGMHADGFVLSYGVGLLAFAMSTISKHGITTMYPNGTSWCWGLLAGFLCAAGFKMSSTGLATAGASVSALQVLISMFPIVSAAVAIPLFREWDMVVLWKLLLGMVLTLAGGTLVVLSVKQAAPY